MSLIALPMGAPTKVEVSTLFGNDRSEVTLPYTWEQPYSNARRNLHFTFAGLEPYLNTHVVVGFEYRLRVTNSGQMNIAWASIGSPYSSVFRRSDYTAQEIPFEAENWGAAGAVDITVGPAPNIDIPRGLVTSATIELTLISEYRSGSRTTNVPTNAFTDFILYLRPRPALTVDTSAVPVDYLQQGESYEFPIEVAFGDGDPVVNELVGVGFNSGNVGSVYASGRSDANGAVTMTLDVTAAAPASAQMIARVDSSYSYNDFYDPRYELFDVTVDDPPPPPPPPPPGYGILFEPIPPEAHSGSGSRPLALTPAALGFELLVGQGFGARPLALRSLGDGYDFVQDFAPSIPANGFLALALSPYAEGYVVGGGSGQRPLTIAARAFSSSAGGAHPTILITSSGYDSAPVFGHAFLEDRMPEMSAYGGAWFLEAGASLTLDDDPFADYMVAVADVLRLTDAPLVLASFLRTVQSSLTLRDFAVAVFEREVLADIALDDEADAVLDLIVQVTAQLMLDDKGASLLRTLHTVVGALALRDSVRLVMQGEVPSEIELADLVDARLQALVEAAAELYLDESIEHSLALFSLVDSPLELGEDALHSLSALVEALSGLDFGVRIRIGDELFVGYAMNVRNTAVSEYENFPFNSMAVIGGVPYGAGPDGIYRLQGDDDDGAPINARVRTAALAFGHLARAPYARIVFTSDGDLLFRTITMDRGVRKENTYRMARRPLGTAVESRFTMAKGVTSSVWAFELSNVDGAYFEADALQVWTMQLDRRYSGR